MPQFILIAYDGTDAGAHDRRMAARQAHLDYVAALRKEKKVICGLALTDAADKMIGSVLVTNFIDRAAFDDYLKNDPYIVQKVWHKTEVLTGKLAPSFVELIKAA